MNSGAYRINTEFLSPQIRRELVASIAESDWKFTHPDGPYSSEAWRVIKLISRGKRQPALEKYPVLKQVLDYFKCDIDEMVFYSILPGGILHPHRDTSGTLEVGRLRFHVPLKTNPGVSFFVSKKRVPMEEGQLWALNTSYLHAVSNLGQEDRIHLVLEVTANKWCWGLLPKPDVRYYLHACSFWFLVGCRATTTLLYNHQKLKTHLKVARSMAQRLVKKYSGHHERRNGEAH